MKPSTPAATIIEALNWRYATKQFDPALKIDDATFDALLEALRLTASSYGLQQWKFIVLENHDIRNELRKAAYDQPQITNASHLIVLCRTEVTEASIEHYIASIAEARKIFPSALDGFKNLIVGTVKNRSTEEVEYWSARQVYIALGTLLEAAALMGVDAAPMEGFDNAKFDEILKLKEKGIASVVCCALGYRSTMDEAASVPKIRFSKEQVVMHIK